MAAAKAQNKEGYEATNDATNKGKDKKGDKAETEGKETTKYATKKGKDKKKYESEGSAGED